MCKLYYDKEGGVPYTEAITGATSVLRARAEYEGQTISLSLRVAWNYDSNSNSNSILYDLTNEKWQCIKITDKGWDILDETSVPIFMGSTKIQYNPSQINQNAKKTIGVDAGFGTSHFAIVVTQFVDGKIQIIFAEEYDRPNFQAMINRIWEIKKKCGHVSNIYSDASNPEIWESLKREFNEPYDNQYVRDQFTYCKKYNLHIEDRMIVVPVPFSVEGAKMLQHTKWLMEETEEDGSSLVAIHKRFDKLLTGLRTAVANEYKLDKEVTSYDDLVDAFRLALTFYKRSKE
jgi:hypothetical protein